MREVPVAAFHPIQYHGTMRTNKPVSQMTPEEKAALKAHMLTMGLDDSDVFPGVLGNRNNTTLTKPLRNRPSQPRKLVKATA